MLQKTLALMKSAINSSVNIIYIGPCVVNQFLYSESLYLFCHYESEDQFVGFLLVGNVWPSVCCCLFINFCVIVFYVCILCPFSGILFLITDVFIHLFLALAMWTLYEI